MRAAVDDAPVVDDDDLVGRLRGGEPVGEGDRGAPRVRLSSARLEATQRWWPSATGWSSVE